MISPLFFNFLFFCEVFISPSLSELIIPYKNKRFENSVKDYSYTYDNDAKAYRIIIKNSNDAKKLLSKYNYLIPDFEVKKGDMDSVFLRVTGGKK